MKVPPWLFLGEMIVPFALEADNVCQRDQGKSTSMGGRCDNAHALTI
jgi:hypothetical protein